MSVLAVSSTDYRGLLHLKQELARLSMVRETLGGSEGGRSERGGREGVIGYYVEEGDESGQMSIKGSGQGLRQTQVCDMISTLVNYFIRNSFDLILVDLICFLGD